jgi:protein O-GlcNAc transferase
MMEADVADLKRRLRALLAGGSDAAVDEVLSLGEALCQLACREEALLAAEFAAARRPTESALWHVVAGLRLELDLPQAALEACNTALRLDADNADSLFNTGVVLERLGDPGAALHCYEKAQARCPEHAAVLLNLGPLLARMGRLEEATVACRRAVCLYPQSADCHYNLGDVLQGHGRHAPALAEFEQARALDPSSARAEMGAALALAALGEIEPARRRWQQVVTRQADILTTFRSPLASDRGQAHPDLRPERIALLAAYDRVQNGEPRAYDTFVALFERLLDEGDPARLLDSPDLPYLSLGLPLAETARQKLARQVSARLQRYYPGVRLTPSRRPRGERLRLAYLSGDLRAHAVAWVMGGLFAAHDRRHFEVYVYSSGPDDGGIERRQAEAGADVFRDVSGFDGLVVAQMIAMDAIDILVDLSGYTQYAKGEALALRPAAIQVSYLGFKGTQGAPYIDYALLDRTLMLPEVRPYWDEKIAYLPHNAAPCTYPRFDLPRRTRAEMGLPAQGLVIAALHTPRKIDPLTYALWLAVLRQVPGAVLWLVSGSPAGDAHLRATAEQNGVDPGRLCFAPKCSHEAYLARYLHADLALDAVRYNGHTTSLDALGMGVPLVTRAGREPVAREGVSMLLAHGFPELVAATDEAFVALAVRLASDSAWRLALRDRLQRRQETDLFCPQRRVRELETAYRMMWARHAAGLAPADFDVPPEVSSEESPGVTLSVK